jgi:hypothetical protein
MMTGELLTKKDLQGNVPGVNQGAILAFSWGN